MKIQLDSWKVVAMNFNFIENEKRIENSFDLKLSSIFPDDKKNTFGVNFEIGVKDINFDLNIEAFFEFKIENEITEEFKMSDFPKVNAPAIAFPYLRAYISNLTLQSGYNPVILPSLNFVNLTND